MDLPENRNSEETSLQKKPKSRKFFKFCVSIVKSLFHMHLEQGILLYMLAFAIGNVLTLDLAQMRACTLQVGGNESYCQGDGRQDAEVQEIMADINIWEEALTYTFPIIYVLFMGAWSDIYGRKFLILCPIFGQILQFVSLLVCFSYKNTSAVIVTLGSVLPVSISGGTVASSMAIYAYYADTVSTVDRTFRTSFYFVVLSAGSAAGYALTGVFKEQFESDLTYPLTCGGTLLLIAFTLILFTLPNTRQDSAKRKAELCHIAADIFDITSIKKSLQTFLKKRKGGRRRQLLWVVGVYICVKASSFADGGTFQQFTTSKQLGWNTTDYAYFQTYMTLVSLFGNLFAMTVLVKWLKMEDITLGILSCISNMGAALVYAFAHNTLMMYIGPGVDLLGFFIYPAFTSIISKIVPGDEIGKVYTVIVICDSLALLAFGPIYAAVYRATLDFFPGCFFLLTAGFSTVSLAICLWFRCYNKITPIDSTNHVKQTASDVAA